MRWRRVGTVAESESRTEETPRRWAGIAQLAVAVALAAVAVYFARAPSQVSIPHSDAAAKPTVPVVQPVATRTAR